MQRLNFTMDGATVELLGRLADAYYEGNKSHTVRAALEALAGQLGHEGWVVAGYSPVVIQDEAACHSCGGAHGQGEVLFRPAFRRGRGARALERLPVEDWLDCAPCAEQVEA
jgi:hypothetical protein